METCEKEDLVRKMGLLIVLLEGDFKRIFSQMRTPGGTDGDYTMLILS